MQTRITKENKIEVESLNKKNENLLRDNTWKKCNALLLFGKLVGARWLDVNDSMFTVIFLIRSKPVGLVLEQ